MSRPAAVIVVAGIDPTGGAGATADIVVLGRLGVRAGTVVTALTVQDDGAVHRVHPVPDDLFEQQLDAALRTLRPAARAVKTGLIVSRAQAEITARAATQEGLPIVVDPVLVAGTGDRFHNGDAVDVLAPLVERCVILTPNLDEAQALAGRRWDGTRSGLLTLARSLATTTRFAAVSGGHVAGPDVPLAVAGPGVERLISALRREVGSTHGTGCAMASATAGYLALGATPPEAAILAHRLVSRAVVGAVGIPGRRISPEPWVVADDDLERP